MYSKSGGERARRRRADFAGSASNANWRRGKSLSWPAAMTSGCCGASTMRAAAAGLGVAWLNRKQIQARTGLDAAGGMKSSDAFAVDPYRACIGLAVEASRRGIAFFEHSAVRKVRFTRKFRDVIGDNGTIRARERSSSPPVPRRLNSSRFSVIWIGARRIW